MKGKSKHKTGFDKVLVKLPDYLIEAMDRVKEQYGTPRNLIIERLIRKWVEGGCDMTAIAPPTPGRDQ